MGLGLGLCSHTWTAAWRGPWTHSCPPPPLPGPTREDQAATVIQCAFRRHLARKELALRRQKHGEYLEQMEKLQREVSPGF